MIMADNPRIDFKDLRQRADFRAIFAHHGLKPVGNGDQLKTAARSTTTTSPAAR
jgi:hypothetical protein